MSRLRIALVVWLLVELWRLWTPSLITVYGQAASTPPEQIGLFALAVMAAPALVAWTVSRLGTRRWPTEVLLAVALVARLLAPYDGGRWQLWLASVGVVAGAGWLCVATARAGHDLWPGLFLGLLLATASHAALGSYGAVWRSGGWAWAVDVLLVALALWPGPGQAPPTSVPARQAVLVMPVLLLALICLVDVGRASAIHPWWGPFLAVTAAAAAAQLADRVVAGRSVRLGAAAVLVGSVAVLMLPEVTRDGVEGLLPWWSLLGVAAGLPALALLVGSETRPPRDATALWAGLGGVVFVAVLFAFYAGYDLGYRADPVVVGLAVVVALGCLPATRAPGHEATVRGAVLAGLVAVLATLLGLVTLRGPADPPASADLDDRLDVAAWNLRMGYGMDGTFRPDAVADQILDSGADVVLLSEVDRGWLLNGGQDQLRVLERLTGLHAVFAPAGDQVWGDAVLTRWPVLDQWSERFPSYDSLTGAEALTVVVDFRGTSVAVVSTHLQPDDNTTDATGRQAADLAAVMARAEEVTRHVVAGGDLNTTPAAPAWDTLRAVGFVDALAAARPLPTSPADAPAEEIDHLLVSGLRSRAAGAVPSTLSDHLMVTASLEVEPAGSD